VLGKGSFGVVYKVTELATDKQYAIKAFKRKFGSWETAMLNAEVKAMIGFKHANVVSCLEVIRQDDVLFILFELLDMDLYKMMQMRKLNEDPFSHEEIRHIIKQIATGLEYIHSHGFFHRDIKPENILIAGKTKVKIGDFGLVKEIRHPTPFTEYVSTRWYRAPENVLSSRSYNYPVDIYALGCIMAELYTFKPLFPGSSEMDQFEKISRIMGKPNHEDWPDAKRLADRKLYQMPDHPKIPLSKVVPRASAEAISLMEWMLQYNPKNRPRPGQILTHEFFKQKHPSSTHTPTTETTAETRG
jgi:serine/threonine protein kinase